MTQAQRLHNLEQPVGPIDVVLDTDTYNEIDDQFALAYLLASGDRLHLKAICAAPFLNSKSTSAADGMHKSYNEILKLLDLAGRQELKAVTFTGSDRFLPDEQTPVESAAARHLIALAKGYSVERPLYVVAIGAITNVASALLLAPDISEKMVLVWLGGQAHDFDDNREFNLIQDVAAARVVFNSGVPIVQLPCGGVVDAFTTTGPELRYWLEGKSALCDYLVSNTVAEAESYAAGRPWSRVIWDVTAVAWLLNDDHRFMLDRLEPTPIPTYDGYYSFDKRRPFLRYVYRIHRDRLFEDLFTRLAAL